jgi:predicted nucleic acid-binding Zn ribbon protein
VSVPDPATAGSVRAVCPLCGAPVMSDDERCRDCGMILAGVDGRPDPFSRRSLWLWAIGLLLIYFVVLAIVALAR